MRCMPYARARAVCVCGLVRARWVLSASCRRRHNHDLHVSRCADGEAQCVAQRGARQSPSQVVETLQLPWRALTLMSSRSGFAAPAAPSCTGGSVAWHWVVSGGRHVHIHIHTRAVCQGASSHVSRSRHLGRRSAPFVPRSLLALALLGLPGLLGLFLPSSIGTPTFGRHAARQYAQDCQLQQYRGQGGPAIAACHHLPLVWRVWLCSSASCTDASQQQPPARTVPPAGLPSRAGASRRVGPRPGPGRRVPVPGGGFYDGGGLSGGSFPDGTPDTASGLVATPTAEE